MTFQGLVVRQPPQYGAFEDTQEELDWYGSNPEGIDRDRTPEAIYPDEVLDLVAKEEDDDDSASEGGRRRSLTSGGRSTSACWAAVSLLGRCRSIVRLIPLALASTRFVALIRGRRLECRAYTSRRSSSGRRWSCDVAGLFDHPYFEVGCRHQPPLVLGHNQRGPAQLLSLTGSGGSIQQHWDLLQPQGEF